MRRCHHAKALREHETLPSLRLNRCNLNPRHLIVLPMKTDLDTSAELSAQIAGAIRDAIVSGVLIVGDRLPSETELSDQFSVSLCSIYSHVMCTC